MSTTYRVGIYLFALVRKLKNTVLKISMILLDLKEYIDD